MKLSVVIVNYNARYYLEQWVKMVTGDGRFLPESKCGYPSLLAALGKIFDLGKLFPASKGMGESSFLSLDGFTHVVYDCLAFSFSTIIALLFCHRKMRLCLGIYNPESRVLVTPEKCYF